MTSRSLRISLVFVVAITSIIRWFDISSGEPRGGVAGDKTKRRRQTAAGTRAPRLTRFDSFSEWMANRIAANNASGHELVVPLIAGPPIGSPFVGTEKEHSVRWGNKGSMHQVHPRAADRCSVMLHHLTSVPVNCPVVPHSPNRTICRCHYS
jgi:hypothetical protein